METNERKRFMSKNNDVKGHRQRVKERFLKTGFDNWQDYEILEFALFFVIPRKDTKQIAKDLAQYISEEMCEDFCRIYEIKDISELE